MYYYTCNYVSVLISISFKTKPRGLLQKYDEEIDGEQKQSFVLGKETNDFQMISVFAFDLVICSSNNETQFILRS